MDKRIIQNTLTFLKTAQISGADVGIFVEVINYWTEQLNAKYKSPEEIAAEHLSETH